MKAADPNAKICYDYAMDGNLAPGAGILLGGAGLAALWQGQFRRVVGLCLGFLPVLGMAGSAFFDEAETQYGNFKGFIERGLRLTPEQIDVLKFLIGS